MPFHPGLCNDQCSRLQVDLKIVAERGEEEERKVRSSFEKKKAEILKQVQSRPVESLNRKLVEGAGYNYDRGSNLGFPPHAKHFPTTCKHREPGPFPSMQLTMVGLSVGEDGRGKGQGSCVEERAQVPRARGECSLGFRCTENASSNPSRARDQNSTQTSCVGKRTHC